MQYPVGEYGLLADGRTAALVDPRGNVAWLCWPRVDSAPCLLSILDDVDGGTFAVAPAAPGAVVVERGYLPGTLVLRTVWRIDNHLLVVREALIRDGPGSTLVRSLHATGSVDVCVSVAFAPDAARAVAQPRASGTVLGVRGGGLDLVVRAPAPWTVDEGGVARSRFTVDSGEWIVALSAAGPSDVLPTVDGAIGWFSARVPSPHALIPNAMAADVLGETTARRLLAHSAAVLTGLRHEGGGIVAAATTSIPQWPGSGRTWDYRYAWLRDTALAGMAMLRVGLVDDAIGLGEFIGATTESMPPPVLLRVDGTAPPREQTLPLLRGYRGARPVRIGNAASGQPQLDVGGEVVVFAAGLAERDALPRSLRDAVARIADWLATCWTEPDHGIWEIRGRPRRYTHSRLMAWVGLTMAAAMAGRAAVYGRAQRWEASAREIRTAVLASGGPLQLHEAGGGPDAALAQAVLFGLFDDGDPRATATLDDIVVKLDRGGLVDRYQGQPDELADPCAPFVFPTLWVAEALHRGGRDGTRHFAAAAASRGALDLFGEVADAEDHTPLGNYPQVQSHAAFVLASVDQPAG